MMKNVFLPVGFLSLCFASASIAEDVKFQLKFEPGKEYLNSSEMKQSMVMPMGGQQMKTAVNMTAVSSQKVSKVDAGIQVVQGLETMKMDMDAAGMKMQFDSENPQGQLAMMFGGLMDAETTMILDENGKVISVEVEAIPGMENLGMGPDEMEQAAREVNDMMPNKVVSEGDSWTSTTKMPMGGLTDEPVVIHYTLTFEKMMEVEGHQVAKVLIKGKVDADDGNLKLTSKELSGVMLFDPAIGQPRELKMIADLEIGLPEGVDAAEGAPGKMPMRTETVTRLQAIK